MDFFPPGDNLVTTPVLLIAPNILQEKTWQLNICEALTLILNIRFGCGQPHSGGARVDLKCYLEMLPPLSHKVCLGFPFSIRVKYCQIGAFAFRFDSKPGQFSSRHVIRLLLLGGDAVRCL